MVGVLVFEQVLSMLLDRSVNVDVINRYKQVCLLFVMVSFDLRMLGFQLKLGFNCLWIFCFCFCFFLA